MGRIQNSRQSTGKDQDPAPSASPGGGEAEDVGGYYSEEEKPDVQAKAERPSGRTVVRTHYESSEQTKPITLSSLNEKPHLNATPVPIKVHEGSFSPHESKSPNNRTKQSILPASPQAHPNPADTNVVEIEAEYEQRLSQSVKTMMKRTEYFLSDMKPHRSKNKKRNSKRPDGPPDEARMGTDSFPAVERESSSSAAIRIRGSPKLSSATPLIAKQMSAPNLHNREKDSENQLSLDSPQQNVHGEQSHYVTTSAPGLSSPLSKGQTKTSGDWENDIARHILSVYASSIAKTDKITSDATLEFVEGPKTKRKSKNKLQDTVKSSSDTDGFNKGSESPTILSEVVKAESANDEEEEYIKLQNKKKFHTEHVARVRGGGGRTVVIRGPPRCYPIYYAGSREVFYDWASLCLDPLNGLKFQAHVMKLREEKRYLEYLKLVDNVLTVAWEEYLAGELMGAGIRSDSSNPAPSSSSSTSSAVIREQYKTAISNSKGYDAITLRKSSGGKKNFSLTAGTNNRYFSFGDTDNNRVTPRSKSELKVFWRQLVLTANAFATLLLEANDTATALLVLQLAESWSNRDDIFSTAFRIEIRSYTNFTYAYLFYKSGKASASMSHCLKAVAVSEKRGNFDLVTTGYLQLSCVYFQKADFITSHEYLYRVLTMVEEGRLSMTDPSPERLCLVAIAYHNLAVVQLKLMCPDAACKSSQNAQKIARLCLSYSNRWLPTFHWTHQVCLEEIEYNLRQQNVIPEDKMGIVGELMEYMYDPKAI